MPEDNDYATFGQILGFAVPILDRLTTIEQNLLDLMRRVVEIEKKLAPAPIPQVVATKHVNVGAEQLSIANKLLRAGDIVRLTKQNKEEENGFYTFDGTHLSPMEL